MGSLVRVALCLGIAFTGAIQASETKAGEIYTFGIVPQQSASRLARMWGPFLNELSDQTGVTFQFRTAKDIPTFEACLAEGAYDVAYMNPMHFAIFSKEASYRAFARQAKKRLKGVIVARKDAGIASLTELNGETIAFPSPGAFGASILTRATLFEEGVDFEPSYVNSHDSVYRAVAAGLMPAGGGVTRTLGAVAPEIREQLEVIHETQSFTPHAFAMSAGFAEVMGDQVQAAFLQIAASHMPLVEGIGMVGLDAAEDADWDDVRALNMTREASGILKQGQLTCPSG